VGLVVFTASVQTLVLSSEGSSKRMIIDISKSIKDLVLFIVEKIPNSPAPPSNRIFRFLELPPIAVIFLSITKVIFRLKLMICQLLFSNGACFFVFTKAQISDRAVALSVFNDLKAYFSCVNYAIPPEMNQELALYAIYGGGATNSDSAHQALAGISLSPADKKAIRELIQTRKVPTFEEAILGYLTVAHKLPKFGADTYPIEFSTGDDPDFQSAELTVGSRGLELFNDSQTLHSDPYY
jgi:hypothetical protein